MRLLDGFIFLLNIIFTVLLIKGRFKKIKATKYIPLISFGFFIFDIIFQKLIWQLYPLYLITVIYFILTILYMTSILKIENISSRPKINKIIISIMILFIIISGISAYAFPVYKIPTPKGKYKIGTESFDITDPQIKAIYSNNLNNNRKIKIQIWYPAETVKDYKRVPWLEDGKVVAKALAVDMKLPSFALEHTALVMSNSFEKAPISNELEKYPIVIISHGWTGFRNLHTDVAEELASNGYIVIGIDHTYGSEVTVFNDGEIAYLNKKALPKKEVTPNFLEYADKLVNTYAGDVNLTLNELEKFNEGEVNSNFKGKFDLSRIGLLGHSTGGGADVSIALKDKRIKAIIGMDAWVEPINAVDIDKGLKIPALFLRSGEWEVGLNNKNLRSLIDKSSGPISLYQINDTTHLDFTMVYMYSPLTKYINITGKLDGRISSSIQKDFIQSFFDKNLKDNNSINISNVADKWKEVKKIK
ncbi:MAG: alpha/beta hydrolase family protein [Clostridium sp.]|uniref:alpha/beta hydrolase family protein n=1 Tax=Clostridium sp. TaxID=1506 RepID=UPI003D6CED8A